MNTKKSQTTPIKFIIFLFVGLAVLTCNIFAQTGDGKIVFTSQITTSVGTGKALFIMNADGSNITQLSKNPTDFATFDTEPELSRDGSKIVFTREHSVNGSYNIDIYSMNADGSNVVQLTSNAVTDSVPSWSPDGAKIVFEQNFSRGNREIFTMNADGTNQIRITSNTFDDLAPAWSPDGAKIVYESINASGYSGIFIMNPDGSNRTQLTNAGVGVDDFTPAWSPDSSKISFSRRLSYPSGNFDIFTMNYQFIETAQTAGKVISSIAAA